ncbi:MAG: hypothetical protein R3C03_02015 [Pirellulaceae bacterium]
MAEGVIFHFGISSREDVQSLLAHHVRFDAETWAAPIHGNYLVLMYGYSSLEADYTASEINQISELLDNHPSYSMITEFRRSHQNEACDLVREITINCLATSNFVVDDSHGRFWTPSQIAKSLDGFLAEYKRPM